ncbi:MAG: alpha/beta fold hydrolase [Gammaproteobacteria bacterium]|nr:alpha/beta fold hydrolase [Gammaproteobacteria bacterium]
MNSVLKSLLATSVLSPGMSLAGPLPVPGSWDTEQRELRFENDGIELVGTLHLPAGAENVPAVVVAHGAGPGERSTPLYQQVADLFPAIGYAAFVYDRRGSGASGGERAGASYRDLARDAIAASQAIATEEGIDPDGIGFWGLSQGGWIVMEAGAMSDPAFVISVSAPLTTPGRQMEILAYNHVLAEGFGETAARQALEARRTVDRYFRDEISLEEARAALLAVQDEDWYEFTWLPSAEALPEDVSQSTWILEMDYDPVEAFKAVNAPLLFVLGGMDYDIPVAESLAILEEIAPAEHREIVVIPEVDHLIRRVHDDADGSAEPSFRSDDDRYFLIMGHWLGHHLAGEK